MDAKEADVKHLKRTPGLSHQYRPFHSKSKDKLLNDKPSCICHPRNKFSRVPKVSRTPLTNSNTTTSEIEGKLDDSGDNKPGTSNLSCPKDAAFEKFKPSHIPRRKSAFSTDREKSSIPKTTPNFLGDSKNVQKVHLLINQEIRPDEKAASIACTRPIPTLGQIYARNNIIHSERFNDWFVELDTPANSIDSNMFGCDLSSGASNDYALKNTDTNQSNNVVVYENNAARRICRPDENMTEWLKTDIEYPTKDNESGYRSMSPKTHKPTEVKMKESKPSSITDIVKNEPEIKEIEKGVPTINSYKSTVKNNSLEKCYVKVVDECKSGASQIKEQPTMILTKTDVSAITDYNAIEKNAHYNKENQRDFCKNCQYPSNVAYVTMESQIPVPSYVDCPSEVLQKTTNFEVDGVEISSRHLWDIAPFSSNLLLGSDTPPTISSVGGLDLEIRDNLSSHFTMEHDDHITDWCSQCKSCDTSDKVESETTSVADSLLCTLLDDDANDGNLVKHLDHHTCWRGFQGDATGQCKKCQRYRKFPSSRYRLPKTLSSIRRRLSIHCRRRLSRVWKKTTERWSVWYKSPHGIRKARMMNYLHRTHIWEDANVQTNVFVCTETGTDSAMKEQKSACISAVFFGPCCLSCRRNESGPSILPISTSNINSRFRHMNMGPSIFPFLRNSRISRRSMSKKKMRENICFNCTQRHNYNSETIDVQTNEIKMFKDTNDKAVDYRSLIESVSMVHISEISVREKSTCTEDKFCTPQMKDKVTSTFIHLDSIKVVNIEPKHEHTQMCVVCNNAETDVRFPNPNIENHLKAASILTSETTDTNMESVKSSGTYTVGQPVVQQRSQNIMTAIEPKRTLNHISTQISPLNKISISVVTSKCWKFVENHDVPKTDFSNQVSRQLSCFKFQGNPSISSEPKCSTKSANISNKECSSTGVSTSTKVETGNFTQPLQVCRCSQNEVVSRGTEPNKRTTSSIQTKLDAYFNTGMLVNTMVEDAMHRNVPKSSVSIDANSIGNKNMVNISTYTNIQLKDSAIETEKEAYPKDSITVCNCGCTDAALNTSQPYRFNPSSIVLKRSANVNTFEPEKDTKSSTELNNLIFSQSNSKRFDNVNAYFVEKKKKSITQPIPELLEIIKHSQRLTNDSSTYSAEKEIRTIAPSKEIEAYSKRSTNTNSVLNVRKETRSIEQNKDIVKKSINISAINIERVTKSTEQSTANINVYNNKSIDVNTHVQQETKSVVQSKAGLREFRTFDDKSTNNSAQFNNYDVYRDSIISRSDSMGQSRLLSVRTLGVHAHEIYVQTDPVRINDGPIYSPDTYKNESVFTSKYILNSAAPTNIDITGRDAVPSRNKDEKTSNDVHKSIRGQSSSNMESDLQFATSALVSSDLDADKWLKSCIERGYQSHLDMERTGESNQQEMEANAVQKHVIDEKRCGEIVVRPFKRAKSEELFLTRTAAQIHSVKNMDTNDLVPTTNFSQQQIVAMIDDMTSDEKELKEMTLQASPATSDAATDCNIPLIEQKSECVFTSRCILPPACRCGYQHLKCRGSSSQDCLFVYDMPRCIVHRQTDHDAAVQISTTKSSSSNLQMSKKFKINQKFSYHVPSEVLLRELYLRSVGLFASCNDVKLSRYHKQTNCREALGRKVYEALYETSKLPAHKSKMITQSVQHAKISTEYAELSKISTSSPEQSNNSRTSEKQSQINSPSLFCENDVTKSDKGVEALLLTDPEVKNVAVVMSRTDQQISVQCNELLNMPVSGEPQPEQIYNKSNCPEGELLSPSQTNQVCKECKRRRNDQDYCGRLLEMPRHDGEDNCKTQLVTSCRYYSKLLTKQLDKVRENITRHLAANDNFANYAYQIPNAYGHQRMHTEACTMKPSAREEFGCQTFKYPVIKSAKSAGILSQAVSLTDICRYDKQNLKSIYFMLSAIEGRIRRIKTNIG